MSFDRLQEKIDKMRNPTVVGLDPALGHIPPQILEKHVAAMGETLDAAAASVFEYNTGLIDTLCDIVPAVKPQSAYYEALGPEGVRVLKATCDYAKSRGLYVILDGKRNDIGSTAEAYSAAYLGTVKVGNADLRPFDADALTINAYLGTDGVIPFIENAVKYDKAVFALVKTSNPSSGELQDRFICGGFENLCVSNDDNTHNGDDRDFRNESGDWKLTGNDACFRIEGRLYEIVGDLIEKISHETIGKYGFTRVGAVAGATYPEEIEFLRKRLKHTFFLVPGYGAQGGSASDVACAFDADGHGAIVNSSRAIIAAWKKSGGDYAAAARAEALRMRDELQECIGYSPKP